MQKTAKLTDIAGIRIGHAHNEEAATGCTVILCEKGACGGVDVRGGAPGTRETDLFDPRHLVDQVHAVLLAGGSAFGLDAAAGVMAYLEEKGCGFDVGVTRVPIVAGAVLFDLLIGDSRIRPDKEMGYQACLNAEQETNQELPEGNVGAGMGATIGKYLGIHHAMKGGLGVSCFRAGELITGAIVAVNCLGDVVDPSTGKIIGGTLDHNKKNFAGTENLMISHYYNYHSNNKEDHSNKKNNADNNHRHNNGNEEIFFRGQNTTIGVVITNARFTKAQAAKVASMAHNGIGRTIRPAHTMFDGDTIFTLATCKTTADVNVVGVMAANAVETAVIRAIKKARTLHGYQVRGDSRGKIQEARDKR